MDTTPNGSSEVKKLNNVVRIDESEIRSHLDKIVLSAVQETLNGLLEAEADQMCGAGRYERTPDRVDTRAGSYNRKLQTKSGEVELKVPKLRNLVFETSIINRYRRRESSIEEALVEMYLAGVSVRRIADVTDALWGNRVSSSTVSKLNQEVYAHIEEWRNRPIKGDYAYVYLDGIYLKRNWGGEVRNVSVLVAIGVNREGFREILGVSEGAKEDKESWRGFLKYLKERGLTGVRLFVTDKCIGLVESLPDFYPKALWQRCSVHFYRNVFTVVPRGKMKEVAAMLKAIHAQEDQAAALEKLESVSAKLEMMKLQKAAKIVREGCHETLSYYNFPQEHWIHLKTNNVLERIMKEIRRRTRVVGSFPDGESALMLVSARLRHIASSKWGTRKYMNMKHLAEMETETEEY